MSCRRLYLSVDLIETNQNLYPTTLLYIKQKDTKLADIDWPLKWGSRSFYKRITRTLTLRNGSETTYTLSYQKERIGR